MYERTSLRPAALCMILLWTVALPCAAITPVLNGRQPQTYSVPKQTPELSGTIDSVDRGTQTIVIDGKSYALPVADVVIHTSDPSTVGTRLAPGTEVRFRAGKAQPGKRPAVTEIWLPDEDKNKEKGSRERP